MHMCWTVHRFSSVHPLPAVYCTTVTRDFMLIVLKVKFVVVTQLQNKKGNIRLEFDQSLCHWIKWEASFTSSPRWIRRLELMMILWPLSSVTTSAMQLGAQEWFMYLMDLYGKKRNETKSMYVNSNTILCVTAFHNRSDNS